MFRNECFGFWISSHRPAIGFVFSDEPQMNAVSFVLLTLINTDLQGFKGL